MLPPAREGQVAASPPVPPPEADPNPAPATRQDAPPEAQSGVARRINVNTAGAAELDLLPGIGPALASRIIADREAHGPFRSLDDLDRVSGIGPKTVAKLAPFAKAE
ncbi:MAG: helix-hairpin-helix domain-containing protein [Phycisphaerales bacterium]|nr:helix-hairpin-helix domain-containing protein [Phycisphaerales bacterium]